MIISHKYKYLFVELPLTGSTAISKELRENYSGESILHKHATYLDFLKIASDEEKQYFVFSGIRNPLDRAVSQFQKYNDDHRGRYSRMKQIQRKGFYRKLDKAVDLARYNYIKKSGGDFSSYFKRYYKVPYDNWSRLSHDKFNYVIRFERIQEDFSSVLDLLGIEQKRPLPVVNKTVNKSNNISDYFTPDTIERAKRIFGPFMEKWGYEFPPEWGEIRINKLHKLEFAVLGIFRAFIWRHLRNNK